MSSIGTNELKTIDGTKSVQVADIADGNVGIGVGQTWQNVIADRELNVEYTNDTGRPIMIKVIVIKGSTDVIQIGVIMDTVQLGYQSMEQTSPYSRLEMSIIIPLNSVYIISTEAPIGDDSNGILYNWHELR